MSLMSRGDKAAPKIAPKGKQAIKFPVTTAIFSGLMLKNVSRVEVWTLDKYANEYPK